MADARDSDGSTAFIIYPRHRSRASDENIGNRAGLNQTGCPTTAAFPHKVTYHASCHSMRSLHLGDIPIRLLKQVRGLDLQPIQNMQECCGFGGTFSIKNADVSSAMLADKVRSVLNTGAEVCTAVDNSCLMHLYGSLHRQRTFVRTAHIAEILASGHVDSAGDGAGS